MNEKLKKVLGYILPPVAVLVLLGWCFSFVEMYPFGDKTIAWCDLRQQSVPLYMQLKDIFKGNQGIFLNMQNAAGMNMWGVIFYYMASPFTLLTLLVKNEDMYCFMNVLIALKMATAAFTANIFLQKSYTKLKFAFSFPLSMMYAFCGYGFIFYQNHMWLDIMYMFPLLMLGFDRLMRKKKPIMYMITLSVCLILNFYLGYMLVFFAILFMGLFIAYKKTKTHGTSTLFVISSIISGVTAAVVLLPCFIQYLGSGRTKNFIENMQSIKFISDIPTILPLILLNSFIPAVLLICLLVGDKKNVRVKFLLIMYALMLVPVFIEPINKMWHTGDYMAFSGRYTFITIFLSIILCALYIKPHIIRNQEKYTSNVSVFWCIALLALAIFCNVFSNKYYLADGGTIAAYGAGGLYSNNNALYGILTFCSVAVLIYALAFIFYRKFKINTSVFSVILVFLVFTEATFFFNVYCASVTDLTPKSSYSDITDLSGKLPKDDDEFYRVKSEEKYFDDCLMGGIGFNSLSHYTSITDKDFMYMAQYMGYSNVWLKSQSNGSTSLCDAIFSNKYTLTKIKTIPNIYSNDSFTLVENNNFLPLGILTDTDLSQFENLDHDSDRADIQEYIYSGVYGENGFVTKYDFDTMNDCQIIHWYDDEDNTENEDYIMKVKLNSNRTTGEIVYNIHVDGKQKLYFDVFTQPHNELSMDCFGAFDVYCNENMICKEYPTDNKDGLLLLGEFTDTDVCVRLVVNKTFKYRYFNLFSTDEQKLEENIANTQTLGLKYKGGKIYGDYNLDSEKWCLISIPYKDCYNLKVNGKKCDYQPVFDDMVAVKLPAGSGNISLTSSPKGFKLSAILSLCGLAGMIVFALNYKKLFKLKQFGTFEKVSRIMVLCAFVATIFMFYILPVAMSLIEKMKYVPYIAK